MPNPSPVAARELVHLLFLRRLVALQRGRVTVKGGVGLRLFFGSPRYSEDMDLDGTLEGSAEIRNCVKGLFDDRDFTRQLQTFGIRGLDPGEGPNKDTDTTFRYKFGVITSGAVRYPTKVEVSFRKPHAADRTLLERPASEILDAHGLDRFEVRRYDRDAAVRQKIDALGGRREAQARDVFDLHILVPGEPPGALLAFLAETLERQRLAEAHARALAISYAEYRGQVFEFLAEVDRSRYATEGMWDEMRLQATALIEGTLARQESR